MPAQLVRAFIAEVYPVPTDVELKCSLVATDALKAYLDEVRRAVAEIRREAEEERGRGRAAGGEVAGQAGGPQGRRTDSGTE